MSDYRNKEIYGAFKSFEVGGTGSGVYYRAVLEDRENATIENSSHGNRIGNSVETIKNSHN